MTLEFLKKYKQGLDNNETNALSYPMIDLLCLKYFPNLVYERKLGDFLNNLAKKGYLFKTEKGSYSITELGIKFIEENS